MMWLFDYAFRIAEGLVGLLIVIFVILYLTHTLSWALYLAIYLGGMIMLLRCIFRRH